MKFFILFSLLGLSFGIPHNRFNDDTLVNREIIKRELAKILLARSAETKTIVPEIKEMFPNGTDKTKEMLKEQKQELVPNEQTHTGEVNDRIIDTYMLGAKEIVNDNHEFLSEIFKSFEGILRSLNGKERRGFFKDILDIIKDTAKDVIKDTAEDVMKDGIQSARKFIGNIINGNDDDDATTIKNKLDDED